MTDDAKEREPTQAEIDAQVAKDLAEAEKSKAEAAKIRAEGEKAAFEAMSAKYGAESNRITLEKIVDQRERELSLDYYRRVYQFDDQVTSSSVDDCISTLSQWHRLDPKCDMTMVLNSPGGGVISGMALFDYLRYLSREGHHLTTVCAGYAASMAGILLQAGDTRICGPESYILIHEISTLAMGKIGELEDEVAFCRKVCDRVVDIFVKRSGGKLTKAYMRQHWTRKDWWIDSDEALRLGIVDRVS